MFQVFAADIFTSKFCNDVSNQQAGMQFRNKVSDDNDILLFAQKYINRLFICPFKNGSGKFSIKFIKKL